VPVLLLPAWAALFLAFIVYIPMLEELLAVFAALVLKLMACLLVF
jgi:hypothetical protein